MNRLGWTILLVFLVVGGGFALLAHFGGSRMPPRATPAGPTTSGPLVIPVAGVAPRQLVDTFADPRGDGSRTHDAIDILAPRGTPVLAAATGRVEKLFYSGIGGHTIYIRSPDGGSEYYYAHLDGYTPGLAEGQAIGRGAVIASVGSTGDADPGAPHLHFEVHTMAPGEHWWQGTPVDPYPLLVAGGGAG